ANERDLAAIVQAETGKPWKSAVAEVGSSADLGVFMESEGSRFYGRTMTSPIPNRSVRTERSPIGVCAAIMPFNSPLAGVAWKAFPALVCGHAVVAKSHELTPPTALALGRLLQEAGLPRGVYSGVQGSGAEVGTPRLEDPRGGRRGAARRARPGGRTRRRIARAGLLHDADRARERPARRRSLPAGAVRPDHVPVSRGWFRRSDSDGECDRLRAHRRHSHVQQQPDRAVHHTLPCRARVDQRADLWRRSAHAVWRRQELGQRAPRAGHRGARRVLRVEDGGREPRSVEGIKTTLNAGQAEHAEEFGFSASSAGSRLE